jgi:ankyrin repeat protein
VLSSTIIDTIEWNHRGTLAFFYFSIQNEPVTLHKFKCSLVVQILKCLIRPSKIVPSFYEAPIAFVKLYREYVPSPEPRVEDLDRVILDLLELSGDAYIIVDALDECVPQGLRSRVIKFLGWLSCADRGNTRILVTSRREPDIEEAIKALTMTKHTVPLHVEEINRDIKKHLENHLQMDTFKRWSGSLKSEVMDYLTKHAEGVFRWVDLQIQALSTQEREKDVRRALKKLPKDLEATYEAILHRIQAEDKAEEALAILRWLAYSTRFLTLAEAAEIAAFEIDDSDVLPEADEFSVAFYPGNRFLEASSIQRILAGLVTVDETGTTSGDVVIYFAHSSVQDYLHSHAVAPPSFRLDSVNSHWFIFKSCNAYIAHYDEADQGGKKEPPYPLMGYACQRVDQHLWELLPYDVRRHCGYQRPPPITTAGEQGKASTLYRRFAAREHTTLGAASLVTRPFVPLGFSFDRFHDALVGAASAGEPELVRLVLDSGTVQPEMGGNTALHAAALKFNVWLPTKTGIPDDVVDYPAVVRELIRAGHSINPAGPGGQTPLHVASAFGYSDIVGCLLEFCDVDVLAADYKGFTPLIMAAESGYGEVVRLLLNHPDVRVDDTDEEGRTALSWAAAGGYDEIVDLLLEYGKANPNAVDCRGRTALIWASSLGRDMVVMRLLSLAAIQPDKRCVLGRTAVSWAALRGHQDIVMRLLNRGDVTANPIDNDGRDIHTLARSRGHAALSPEDAADTKVDNDTIALVDSDSLRSLTLSSSTTATFNTRVSIDKLPSKLKSETENRDILDFQALELGNHQREVWYVQFSNDGRQLVTCGGFHRVIIWDLATRAALFALKGHKDFVTRAAWSPDDSMLVTVSVDSHARLWDADVSSCSRLTGFR